MGASVSLIRDACGEPLTVTTQTILPHENGDVYVRCLECSAFKHFTKEDVTANPETFRAVTE